MNKETKGSIDAVNYFPNGVQNYINSLLSEIKRLKRRIKELEGKK